jgi:hypothetical protein
VVCTQVCRTKGNCFGFVTHLLKVVRRLVNCNSADVFGKDVPGSNICHDSAHFRPKIIGRVFSCCGVAVSLARKSSSDDINNPAPRLSVKGTNVIPYWEWGSKASVILPLCKSASAVPIQLDSADCSESKHLRCKQASTSAREKSQLIHHHGAGSKGMGSGLIFFGFTHLLPTNAGNGHLPALTAFLMV